MGSSGRTVLRISNNLLLETTYKSKLLLNCIHYRSSTLSIFRSCLLTRCLSSCHNLSSRTKIQTSVTSSSRSGFLNSNKTCLVYPIHRGPSWQLVKGYATPKPESSPGDSSKKEIVQARESPYAHLTMAEKGKDQINAVGPLLWPT